MFDFRLFKVPTFTGAQITAFVMSSAMFAQFLFIPLYIENVLGYSAVAAGVRFLPLSLVSFVVGSGRARDLPKIIDPLVRRSAEERAEVVADVRSAIPLDEDQQARLAEALSKRTGQKVSVKVNVDPSILGGIVATIGDTVIDGSVRRRLEQLKDSF